MATIVERTSHEIGLDLTTVDFCTQDLLVLLRSMFKFPPNSDEPSENPGTDFGASVHSGYTESHRHHEQAAACPVLLWTKDCSVLFHFKLNSGVSPFLAESYLSSHTACCKSNNTGPKLVWLHYQPVLTSYLPGLSSPSLGLVPGQQLHNVSIYWKLKQVALSLDSHAQLWTARLQLD